MDWTEVRIRALQQKIDQLNVIGKKEKYLPEPSQELDSYWETYCPNEDIQEYGPQNAMDIMKNMESYFTADEGGVLMPFIIEIMKSGMYLDNTGKKTIETNENKVLEIPDYVYVF